MKHCRKAAVAILKEIERDASPTESSRAAEGWNATTARG